MSATLAGLVPGLALGYWRRATLARMERRLRQRGVEFTPERGVRILSAAGHGDDEVVAIMAIMAEAGLEGAATAYLAGRAASR